MKKTFLRQQIPQQSTYSKWLFVILCCFCTALQACSNHQLARLTSNQLNEFSPVYSPDGLYVAFIREQSGADRHVWLKSLATATEWQLTNTAEPLQSLVFSHDGQSLTYLSRDNESDIISSFDVNFKKGLASPQYNQLTFNSSQIAGAPMWLDEDTLLYIRGDDGTDAALMSWTTSTGMHKQVTRFIDKMPIEFSLSPDKRNIALTFDNLSGQFSIELYNLAQQKLTDVVTLTNKVHSLSWHPNNLSLLVASDDKLLKINLNGERQILTTNANQSITHAQYHPKKERILMTLVNKSNDKKQLAGSIVTLSLVNN